MLILRQGISALVCEQRNEYKLAINGFHPTIRDGKSLEILIRRQEWLANQVLYLTVIAGFQPVPVFGERKRTRSFLSRLFRRSS